QSLLVRAVGYADEDLKMPPKQQLTAQQVADLTKWIQDGAAWPGEHMSAETGKPNPEYEPLRRTHWAWQPLRDARPPAVRREAWPNSEVDRFLLAALEARG